MSHNFVVVHLSYLLNTSLRCVRQNQAINPLGALMEHFSKKNGAKYDGVARLIHWLVVVLIAAQFVIGWTMPDVHKGTQPTGLIAWHLAVGAVLIAVMTIRIVWRITHRPPPDTLAPLLSAISKITHLFLYAALIAVPLLGWANASSRGWAIRLLGVFSYPNLTPVGSSFGHAMGDIHGELAWVLFALIVMHVGAAIFHRFVLRDQVLQRMAP